MISDVLQKYIPFGSYVEYLNGTGHAFTDFEEDFFLFAYDKFRRRNNE